MTANTPNSPQQPLDIEQALGSAMQHQSAGRFAQAEQLYRQVLEQDGGHPVALHLLGVLAHMAKQSDVGIDLIRSAIANAPDYVAAHNNLGNVLRDVGKFEAAIEAFNTAIELKPDYAEAFGNLGLAQQGLGHNTAAIGNYKRALLIL